MNFKSIGFIWLFYLLFSIGCTAPLNFNDLKFECDESADCKPGWECREKQCVPKDEDALINKDTGSGDLASCIPDCKGKVCGDNGCGGSCGQCKSEQACLNGQCKRVLLWSDKLDKAGLSYTYGGLATSIDWSTLFAVTHNNKVTKFFSVTRDGETGNRNTNEFPLDKQVIAPPASDFMGNVFLQDLKGEIMMFHLDNVGGQDRIVKKDAFWATSIRGHKNDQLCSPMIVSNGFIYVITKEGLLLQIRDDDPGLFNNSKLASKLDVTGDRILIRSCIPTSMVFSPTASMLVACIGNTVWGVLVNETDSQPSLKHSWHNETLEPVQGQLNSVVTVGDYAFICSSTRLTKISIHTGDHSWQADLGAGTNVITSPVVGPKNIYLATSRGIFAFDRETGDHLWFNDNLNGEMDKHISRFVVTAVTEAGIVVLDRTGGLWILSEKDGHELMHKTLPDSPIAIPVVTPDYMAVLLEDSRVLGLTSSDLRGPWPQFLHDAQRMNMIP